MPIKRRHSKSKRLAKVRAEHDVWLGQLGFDTKKKFKDRPSVVELPDLSVVARTPPTSDKIAGNGTRIDRVKYTGNEVMGIGLVHKSGYEPIRKDNPQAAIELANMRRS